jgi:hypothetical protein
MTYYQGKKSYVGISRQDTAGTVEATPAIYIPTETWPTLKTSGINYYAKEFRAAMGGIQNVYRKSNITSSGDVSAHAYSDWLTYAFYGVLGKTTSAQIAAEGAYTHAINADAATLPIWTVFTGLDTVNQLRYRDLTMQSINLGFQPGERISTSVSFQGGPVDIASATLGASATYTNNRPFDYADVAVSLGASNSDCEIESMDLMISRAPYMGKVMCTGNTAWNFNKVIPNDVICEGTFNMLFIDYEDYELWLGANNATTVLTDTYDRTSSDQALTITVTSTGPVIGNAATHDQFIITVPEILYDDSTITPTWDDKVRVTFAWKAVHNATAESAVAGTGTVKVDIKSEVVDPST